MDSQEKKMINLDKRLLTLETTFNLKMEQISNDIVNLSETVSKTTLANQKFLENVEKFIKDITTNYVPMASWNEHIKEDAVVELELAQLKKDVDNFQEFKRNAERNSSNMNRNYKMYVYPVLINLLVNGAAIFVGWLLLKLKRVL